MEQTARFQIPLLAPGQAQKEFYHNEALEMIAALLCPVVEDGARAEPPTNPDIGACYLIASGASGAWLGKDGTIAFFTAGGWRFIAPIDGLSLRMRESGEALQWRAGGWEAGISRVQQVQIDGQTVIRGRQPAISEPAGGTVIDSESRAVLAAVLDALRTHGLIA